MCSCRLPFGDRTPRERLQDRPETGKPNHYQAVTPIVGTERRHERPQVADRLRRLRLRLGVQIRSRHRASHPTRLVLVPNRQVRGCLFVGEIPRPSRVRVEHVLEHSPVLALAALAFASVACTAAGRAWCRAGARVDAGLTRPGPSFALEARETVRYVRHCAAFALRGRRNPARGRSGRPRRRTARADRLRHTRPVRRSRGTLGAPDGPLRRVSGTSRRCGLCTRRAFASRSLRPRKFFAQFLGAIRAHEYGQRSMAVARVRDFHICHFVLLVAAEATLDRPAFAEADEHG